MSGHVWCGQVRGKSSDYQGVETDEFGFRTANYDFEPESDRRANSSEEVIGEMALVLVVITGIVVVVNIMLIAMHIG